METREGCQAHILLTSTDNRKFEIIKFHEGHVHPCAHLVGGSLNGNVSFVHKDMVCKYTRPNVGSSKVYHILKEQVGGCENISCMLKDLQNYHRDLKALIKDTEAHMFIDVLKNKKEVNPGFFFDYQFDEDNRLNNVF